MRSREDVIKGLEETVDWLSTETSLTVVDQWVVRDALALLKSQEPRVMTWQEIVDTAPQMPFIWLESKENNDRVFQSILFKTWLWDSTVTIITVMTEGWLFEGQQVNYGRTWRCWTSRPTEAERRAVKWE